jgi:spore maturation protein CgeB
MRILLIHPAHGFATADVYTGVLAGLRANGVEVVEYRLDVWLDTAHIMVEAVKTARQNMPLLPLPDEYAIGIQAAVGYAIWKECTHVLVITGQHVHMSLPLTLRKAGIKTALLCTESPYLTIKRERHDAQLYDVVFTHERRAIPLFQHKNVHYLPHAYNAEVHQPAGDAHTSDVFFVGTGFDERQALFGAVDWTGIDFRCLGALWHGHAEAGHLLIDLLPNTEAAKWYRGAKVNLNHHRTTADWSDASQITVGADSLGPRAYEIAACKGFQLCDDSRAEWFEVFADAYPVETSYQAGDPESLERAIRYWLKYEGRRERVAALQHAAVQGHTWQHRARELITILDTQKPGGASATRRTGGHPHGYPTRL